MRTRKMTTVNNNNNNDKESLITNVEEIREITKKAQIENHEYEVRRQAYRVMDKIKERAYKGFNCYKTTPSDLLYKEVKEMLRDNGYVVETTTDARERVVQIISWQVAEMTKKEKKKQDNLMRVRTTMNTGTRPHKDKKHPSRQDRKREERKEYENYN